MPKEKKMNYKDAGVDVVKGDEASEILFNVSKATWKNRVGKLGEIIVKGDNFRTSRYFATDEKYKDVCYGINFDGIGTKVEIAERLYDYRGLAKDLIAMTCDDASIQNAEPLLFGSIIDMAKVKIEIIRQISEGLVEACSIAGVSVINGELAELPGRISGYGHYPFNWGGACHWGALRSKIANPVAAIESDCIVAISEYGFRSNGFSLLREIFKKEYGRQWGVNPTGLEEDLVKFAASPSTIYTPFILALTGGLSEKYMSGIRSMIHVTGGGIIGRLKHFCKKCKIGAKVVMPNPPDEMCEILKIGGIDEIEAYGTWNMGFGLLIICEKEKCDKVINNAERHNLSATVIGKLESNNNLNITLFNKKAYSLKID